MGRHTLIRDEFFFLASDPILGRTGGSRFGDPSRFQRGSGEWSATNLSKNRSLSPKLNCPTPNLRYLNDKLDRQPSGGQQELELWSWEGSS